jgi:Kef-type K+ transport system membrane component KefB
MTIGDAAPARSSAATAVIAQAINLPGIVGAFLFGPAINAAAHSKPAREKLEFISNKFFIPIFLS